MVRSPSKSSEIKSFLGYEWSSAKGKEGIKYIGGVSIDEVISEIDEDEESVALEPTFRRLTGNKRCVVF